MTNTRLAIKLPGLDLKIRLSQPQAVLDLGKNMLNIMTSTV
jgi:hypothetical protein